MIVDVCIVVPWVVLKAMPFSSEQGLQLYTIPPGSTLLSSKEPKETPRGMVFEFSYDDGGPEPGIRMSVGSAEDAIQADITLSVGTLGVPLDFK